MLIVRRRCIVLSQVFDKTVHKRFGISTKNEVLGNFSGDWKHYKLKVSHESYA